MKQLFQIGLDLALASLNPIISWFMLSLILDSRLINVFSITYPLQFVWLMLRDIFGVGANLVSIKVRNSKIVDAGIFTGLIFSGIIFGLVALNIDKFIIFMNADPSIYRDFCLYIALQLWIQLVFCIILDKLYYQDKNKIANKYSLTFNLLNFIVFIGASFLTKNSKIIISATLLTIFAFTLFVFIREVRRVSFRFNILRSIKINSMDFGENLILFFVYLFGIGKAFSFGEEYALAITFVTLITDIQWDVATAIQTKTKIDIAKKRMNFPKSYKNSYVLIFVLILSSIIAFVSMKNFYDLNLGISITFVIIEYLAFLLYPQYRLKLDFIQLKFSAKIATFIKSSAMAFRLLLVIVFSPITPFALSIAQVLAQLYQVIFVNLVFSRRYKILSTGRAIRKNQK
ncbi:hypothetical protein [Candidatus Nanogingivalis gingivitcus]|jgi:membrane protein|uniref:Polysaccharide biosynthesis protein n=1 Tax=Candidatus Nanogingivalis gingivitcus TaxID=2171992 RepID=A0ABY0FJD2_9BACT|nr:hypothetical protein [Candidatus Nanogingivalis gingivitcus]RYC72936.1 hypothetical protein G6CMJM_00034 [Candidatus Nanogingivalis gingivitcus]